MMEISRRDFIRLTGVGAVATVLSRNLFASADDFDSIDSVTEKMLSELGKATKSDIKDYKPDYLDNASFSVSARIKEYNLNYRVPGYDGYDISEDENEALTINSERKSWRFEGKGSLENGVSNFGIEDLSKHTGMYFNPEQAGTVPVRIRDLLDINVHLQDCKGKDLTPLVNDLSGNVLSIKNFDVKYKKDLEHIKASFKKGDFEIEYLLDDVDKWVQFTILDGKNRLSFFGIYNKDGNIDTLDVSINSSYFKLFSGKLERFLKKVYNESSAMGIIENTKGIEKYLTSTIKNTKLENYTGLFKRLISTKVDNSIIINKDSLDHIKIRVGELDIKYDPHAFYDYIYLTSGNNQVEITIKKDGIEKIREVIINDHPFLLYKNGSIGFIRSTYTEEQATSIINGAKEFYYTIKGIAKSEFFLSKYVGQPLVRHA